MKTLLKLRLVLVAVVMFTMVGIMFTTLSGCNQTAEKNKDSVEVIKIGAILPLTGKYADVGNQVLIGLNFAIKDINKSQNRIQYVLLKEDARSEPSTAVSAYNKLVNIEKADFVITTTSGLSMAIKPQALKDSVLLFCIASHPEITQNNNGLIFRPCNTSIEEGNAISKYILEEVGNNKSKVWIIYHNSEFGVSFNSEINQALSGLVIGSSSYDDKLITNSNTIKSIVTEIIKSDPDYVIAIGFTPSLGTVIKSIREYNYNGKIISNIGFSSPSVLNSAGDASKEVLYVEYEFPSDDKYFKMLDSLSHVENNIRFGAMSYLSYFSIAAYNFATLQLNSYNKNEISTFLRTQNVIDIKGIKLTTFSNGNIQPKLFIKKHE